MQRFFRVTNRMVLATGLVLAPFSTVAFAASDTESAAPMQVAKAEADVTTPTSEAASDDETTPTSASDSDEKKEDTSMVERTPEQEAEFKQTMHDGDIALGVCGARVSALLWFYEASVAQGRDDLKEAVASLTDSRAAIKAEAERRAVEDKVDTSVRVMNDESQKLWDDLNKKASGDTDDFQKAHDELLNGVQECLSLFFERPEPKDDK